MYLVYSLFLLLSLSYFIKIKFKINEYYIPLIVLCSIGIELFLFGIVDQMKIGYYLIILSGLLSFIYLISLVFKRKLVIKDFVQHQFSFYPLPKYSYISCLEILIIVIGTNLPTGDQT